MLEQKLSRVLPERLEVVAEQSIFHHLCLVLLVEELHDFVRVAHLQSLRLLERVHEVKVKCLASVAYESVRDRVILVVESQAPWGLLALALQADCRIELDTDWQVPLERLLVVFEPHGLVVVD